MSLANLSPGKDVPNNINVIIEISAFSEPTKYEVDKDSGLLCVDRFLQTSMVYPTNYGYVPSTLCDDGDPADVMVLTPAGIQPGAMIRCRPIGMLPMTDESGEDNKILALPIEKVCAEYAHIQSLDDVSEIVLKRIKHFFEHYKDLTEGKWVKVGDWQGVQAAKAELKRSVLQYQNGGEVSA